MKVHRSVKRTAPLRANPYLQMSIPPLKDFKANHAIEESRGSLDWRMCDL